MGNKDIGTKDLRCQTADGCQNQISRFITVARHIERFPGGGASCAA
jgi:hypothetical protein